MYALTFTLRDAFHLVGGFGLAKRLVWVGLFANALLVLYGALVNALPLHPPPIPKALYALSNPCRFPSEGGQRVEEGLRFLWQGGGGEDRYFAAPSCG